MLQIDLLTGKYTPLSTELVVSINIGAAFIQGYGWNSMENTFSREGKLETRVHSEYNIPSIASCPSKFNATLLKSEILLYSSKGIGEPPFLNRVSNSLQRRQL